MTQSKSYSLFHQEVPLELSYSSSLPLHEYFTEIETHFHRRSKLKIIMVKVLVFISVLLFIYWQYNIVCNLKANIYSILKYHQLKIIMVTVLMLIWANFIGLILDWKYLIIVIFIILTVSVIVNLSELDLFYFRPNVVTSLLFSNFDGCYSRKFNQGLFVLF